MCFDVPHLNMNAAPVTVQYAFVWKGAVWTFSKEKRKLYGLKQSQIPSKFFILRLTMPFKSSIDSLLLFPTWW